MWHFLRLISIVKKKTAASTNTPKPKQPKFNQADLMTNGITATVAPNLKQGEISRVKYQ